MEDFDELAESDDPADRAKVRAALGDSNSGVRSKAIKALQKADREEDAPEIVKLLEDPRWLVRLNAAQVLWQVGSRADTRALELHIPKEGWMMRKLMTSFSKGARRRHRTGRRWGVKGG